MYREIAGNKRKTVILVAVFVLFVAAIGGLFAYLYNDTSILIWVLVFTLIYTIFQYFMSGNLAVAMSGAKEIQKKDDPRFYNIVENLVIQEGLPMPKVYIIQDSSPNAFAAGRDPQHAVVAATTGLLTLMNDPELQAVMAHEIAHVKNYDIRLSTIVFGLVSAIGILSEIGWRIGLYGGRGSKNNNNAIGVLILVATAILAPLIATIVQLAVSRNREYLADSTSALITRHPDAMISALKKLGAYTTTTQAAKKSAESNPFGKSYRHNAALQALFINAPATNLFSTHPPIVKRIARLESAKAKF
ncbi:MAG: M48 family metalloprotease [Candidatus Nomurabacteria bacterium]|jgi:heat shock protein HtpX|nr:M48 family metalloprotease [Candidatus Nomurabacteria bacterium]